MIDLIESNRTSSKIAIIDRDREFSYEELGNISNSYFKYLKAKTIVLIIGENSLETIAFYIACLYQEVIPLFLNEAISINYLENYITALRPTNIFCKKNLNFSNIQKVNAFGEYNLYYLNGKKIVSDKSPSILLTTSGSTGNPKLVKVTKKNLVSNTKSICNYLAIDNKSKHITTLPISYTYGLSCINTHLHSGGKIIINNESVISRQFWDLVKRTSPNTMAGVPYTYEMLFKLGLKRLNLDSIKTFTQAGGKLSDTLIKEYCTFCDLNDKEFIVMYGQTEATARMSYISFNDLKRKIGSIGKPIPNGSLKIINCRKYQKINGFEVGELIYSGPNVCPGYASSFEEMEIKEDKKKYLDTGDLAYKDDEGFFYICGRKNRFAKISGIRVSLDDVEMLSKELAESAVTSDDKYINIFFKKDENDNSLGKKLKNIISTKVNIPHTLIKTIELEEIPRAASGKILHNNLRK